MGTFGGDGGGMMAVGPCRRRRAKRRAVLTLIDLGGAGIQLRALLVGPDYLSAAASHVPVVSQYR